jgi:hypothetical protein
VSEEDTVCSSDAPGFVDSSTNFLVLGREAADAYRRLGGFQDAGHKEVMDAILAALEGAQFVRWIYQNDYGRAFVLRLALAGFPVTCDVTFIYAYEEGKPRRSPDGKLDVVIVKQLWLTGTTQPDPPPRGRGRLGQLRLSLPSVQKKNTLSAGEKQAMHDSKPVRVSEASRRDAHSTPQQLLDQEESRRKAHEGLLHEAVVVRGELQGIEENIQRLNNQLRDRLPYHLCKSLTEQREDYKTKKKAAEVRLGEINTKIRLLMPGKENTVYQILDTLLSEVRELRQEFVLLREAMTRHQGLS